MIPTWDKYYLDICRAVAARSKDPRTKVGAVIVGPAHEIRSTGYNGFPRGMKDEIPERWDRPAKHDFMIHAEMNAIVNAARCGTALEGCDLYADMLPCPNCCKAIVQARIKRVIIGSERLRAYDGRWLTPEVDALLRTILHEGGVRLEILE